MLKRRNWTAEETEYLQDCVGQIKVSTIALNLNRSEQSVLLKMKRLGIGNTKEKTGYLTVGELAKLLRIERNIVCGWIRNHGLECTQKITRNTKKYWFVDPIDFWDWAEDHKEKIDYSKVDFHSIPPEPDWVRVERQKCKEITQYKKWTTQEERQLVNLISQGKTYGDAAKRLERTKISIEKKYKRIVNG